MNARRQPTSMAWALAAMGLAVCLMARPALAHDTVYYYYTNTLHSAVVETDASGTVLERTYYAPYGQVLNRDMRDGPGYTGHEEDPATGLVYMQQRYYDPQSGRFISTDPVAANGGSFNRYAYASDNPYRYTDPTGMCTGTHICNKDGTTPITGGYTTGSTGAMNAMQKAHLKQDAEKRQAAASQRAQAPASMPSGAAAVTASEATDAAHSAADLGKASKSWLGKWKGKNGRWYSESWGGNGATGARSSALRAARIFDLAGKGLFTLSLLENGYGFYRAAETGDRGEMAASSANAAWAAASTFGGPVGLAGGLLYTITSGVVRIPAVYNHTVVPAVNVVCRVPGLGC